MTRIAARSPAVPSTPLPTEGQYGAGAPYAATPAAAVSFAASAAGGSSGFAPSASSAASGEPSAFARMVGSLGTETTRGEAAMKTALSAHGSDLGAADLLALQAGVYRYGEVVDLASRLVDRATSNVKTVLQGSGS